MNWYGLLKIAQIWQTETDTDFSFVDQITALYKLEYKYSMLKNKPFRGMPQRRDNILNQLRQRLSSLALEIRGPIIATLQSWLSSHALLDPNLWAVNRVNTSLYGDVYDEGDSTIPTLVNDIIHEYRMYNIIHKCRYFNSVMNPSEVIFKEFMQKISNNIGNFPQFKSFLEVIFFEDYQQNLYYDLESLGYEEFGQMFNKTFNTPEEGESFIEKLTIDDVGVDEVIELSGINNLDTFTRKISYEGDLVDGVLAELYEKFVFPLWYAYWGARGIGDTRAAVEEVYNNLLKATVDDLENFIVYINAALASVHQNGPMLEYLQEYVEQNAEDYNTYGEELDLVETFNYLSLELDTTELDKELRAIGVSI